MPELRPCFDWLRDDRLQRILGVLNNGGQAMLVGGCVRDSLLGHSPFEQGGIDIDIATDRTPEEMKALFAAAKIRTIPTGEQHGTITAMLDGLSAECTALRADVATDGRHADVRFTRDWDEDWRRRDFTINALYADAAGSVWDPVGGQADLTSGRVRFIGEAEERIHEDSLRILRFFRFSSRFADAFDEAALLAISKSVDRLDILSKERVQSELFRTLVTPHAAWALRAADEAGVLSRLIPSTPRVDVFEALRKRDVSDEAALMFGLWPGRDADSLRSLLRVSNDFSKRYEAVAAACKAVKSGMSALELTYRCPDGFAQLGVEVAFAEGAVADLALLDDVNAIGSKTLPLSGKDIVARGIQPGPEIAQALKKFEDLWLAAGAPGDANAIERLLTKALGG